MEILEVLVRNLALLPPVPGTPGRGFVCVGVRAYIHRLVGYIGPECGVLIKPTNEANNGDVGAGHPASDMLLRGIVTATPYLVAIVSPNNPNIILEDQDVRWKELKEHIPLFSQLVARYKVRKSPLFRLALFGFFTLSVSFAEFMPSNPIRMSSTPNCWYNECFG